jgi:hypothetical protein
VFEAPPNRSTPSPELLTAAVPARFVPMRLPSTAFEFESLSKTPVLLPEIKLRAPGANASPTELPSESRTERPTPTEAAAPPVGSVPR